MISISLRKLCGAALLGLCVTGVTVSASDRPCPPPPACEPGYTVVAETVYQEVVRKVCKLVPEVKKTKKTVYEVKEESYCLPQNPRRFGCAAACPSCEDQARCRKVLVKKEVVEECPSFKCVVEEVVDRVPCTVYRKVPCPPAGR